MVVTQDCLDSLFRDRNATSGDFVTQVFDLFNAQFTLVNIDLQLLSTKTGEDSIQMLKMVVWRWAKDDKVVHICEDEGKVRQQLEDVPLKQLCGVFQSEGHPSPRGFTANRKVAIWLERRCESVEWTSSEWQGTDHMVVMAERRLFPCSSVDEGVVGDVQQEVTTRTEKKISAEDWSDDVTLRRRKIVLFTVDGNRN
ncbi:Hypothetical predicted protein, partial [Paramuricea clavata]